MESYLGADSTTEGITPNELAIPEMMFAEGEEPVGIRILTYQSSRSINTILDALDEDEIQYLRGTSFGKLVEIAEKPGFSGRFARYLLSRQLKVEKKHEAWFRFSGKPIRFSIREFAIVTGLPCGEIPKKQRAKKKKNSKEKLYWPELFGNVEDMRVSRAVKMLRRKTVTDKDTRLKLACLAIVSSVLLSTNLKMKMLKEHAQLLGDIEEFLAFPWGRLADEVSLSQNTIALKGFALALQLVMVEAEDNDSARIKTRKQTLSPAHAREVDKKTRGALVRSIIPQDSQYPIDESLLLRSDEVPDVKVDNLVTLINADHCFFKSMFKGGLTKLDVDRLRVKENVAAKRKQPTTKQTPSADIDESKIMSVVVATMQPEITRIDGTIESTVRNVKDVANSADLHKADVLAAVNATLLAFKNEMMSAITKQPPSVAEHNSKNQETNQHEHSEEVEEQNPPLNVTAEQTTPPAMKSTSGISRCSRRPCDDVNDAIINDVMESLSEYSTPTPSGQAYCGMLDYPVSHSRLDMIFLQIGIHIIISHHQPGSRPNGNIYTRHAPSFSLGLTQEERIAPSAGVDDTGDNDEALSDDNDDVSPLCRKSKRLKSVPAGLVNDYECGTAILSRSWESQMCGDSHYTGAVLRQKYTKLTTILTRPCSYQAAATRFYFLLNVSNKHWIGLCIDCPASKIYVLDYNSAVLSDASLSKELHPIADMFLPLLKFCGRVETADGITLSVDRIKGVPQNTNPADAGITAALLMQTHALFGADLCRCINPLVLTEESQRAAVMLYEFSGLL
ncbi:hypothetical protein Bca52824_018536 [Brassica carinata]|uniref:Ubiquitin-like protease family profile domain-containing protein n=1 Tax=Brassica carinata TaxID=52824 RepID=A0A8X8AWH2_BRACI|nr:hypothetical protein Bca52824_018536 [Brassica carinata]